MQDYAEQLILAINNLDNKNEESVNHLRDLVCWISDNDELKKDKMISELLYIASQKMRVFGYNILNKFTSDPNVLTSDITKINNESIKNLYRSKVYPNNILDKSQKNIIDCYQNLNPKRLLVSAPTSYGKTFLMRELLFLNKHRYKNILLVFPTVALLLENAKSMEKFVKDLNLEYNVVKTVDSVKEEEKNIFVFTPERALQLIANYPNLKIDFFFFDEVYKIDEDYFNDDANDTNKQVKVQNQSFLDADRGKIFRIALYLLSKSVTDYYLAGPNLSQEQFGQGMKNFIAKNNIHIEEIKFEPTLRIGVNAYGKVIKENLPKFTNNTSTKLISINTKVNEKIKDVITYINHKNYGKTLLYCSTPSKAIEYSNKLSDNFNNDNYSIYPTEFKKFIEHIKFEYDIDNSSDEWSLIKVLKNGFGLHHGKLPKYIQQEILEQFNNGVFNVLFCTSTIVEGVNTDAQNMIIMNSSKGSKELTPFDIKNIKGRAGRYYHCFIGRVFYMNKKLIDIENSEGLKLDFVTYSNKILNNIDLDNAEKEDLTQFNKKKKFEREEMTANYLIPYDVFIKNRTVPKDDQEKVLRCLMNYEEFIKYEVLLKYEVIVENFLKYRWLRKILDTFCNAGLIEKYIADVYFAVANCYYEDGFKGILKYELKNRRGSVDDAYSRAFKSLKDIIEHKIPKILTLFECLFIFVAKKRGYSAESFSLSKVCRYYETGVKSQIGEALIEYGFPNDAIRRLEQNHNMLLSLDIEQAKEYCFVKFDEFKLIFDQYELQLFEKAMDSL